MLCKCIRSKRYPRLGPVCDFVRYQPSPTLGDCNAARSPATSFLCRTGRSATCFVQSLAGLVSSVSLFLLCVPVHGGADHLIVLVFIVDPPLEPIVARLSNVHVSNDAYKPKTTGRLLLDRPVGSAPVSDHSYSIEGKPAKRTLTGTAATARLLRLYGGSIEALPRDR